VRLHRRRRPHTLKLGDCRRLDRRCRGCTGREERQCRICPWSAPPHQVHVVPSVSPLSELLTLLCTLLSRSAGLSSSAGASSGAS
jgi:hypothetical protein